MTNFVKFACFLMKNCQYSHTTCSANDFCNMEINDGVEPSFLRLPRDNFQYGVNVCSEPMSTGISRAVAPQQSTSAVLFRITFEMTEYLSAY